MSPAIARRLLAIANEYRSYGRVDDEARWAPTDCRMPRPASAHMSKSRHAATHGRKLYSLFARDQMGYLAVANLGAAPGQVIVKESWSAREVAPEDVPKDPFYTESIPLQPAAAEPAANAPVNAPAKPANQPLFADGDRFNPYVRDGDTWFRTGERGPLFIMYKPTPEEGLAAESTDLGWVYGTVTADRTQVTAAGRIASCMGCHRKAPHGRLFGLGYAGTSE